MTPASGKFLLDTNAAIELMEGGVQLPTRLASDQQAFLPTVVLGELFFGAAKSSRPAENAARVERRAGEVQPLTVDLETARDYGRLKQRLRAKGRPIPENDLWIAALAVRHGMVLVTRDRHFTAVEGLATVDWTVSKL